MKPITKLAASLALSIGSVSAHAAPVLWIDDSLGQLGTVDVATGTVSLIGNMGVTMTDIAFDPLGNLYGISFTSLYSINRYTAAATIIGSTGISSNSLVFGSDGTLYTANTSLYRLNTSTGASSLIGTGGGYSSSGDLAFIDGQLYLSSAGGDQLFQLNHTTGAGTLVGSIGYGAVYGMATNNNVDLYGVTGTNILSLNTATGAGSLVLNYAGHGLGAAYGTSFVEEAAVVPIPAAIWLFGAGLVGMVGFARRNEAAITSV